VGDQGLLTIDDVDHQVRAANILVECQPLALGKRVVGGHDADTYVVEEKLLAQPRGRIRNVEAQIESPVRYVVEHRVGRRLDPKRGMGRERVHLASDLM